ncbi:MAG: SDR family oxidoreductase [Pseudomonadota bacterium]
MEAFSIQEAYAGRHILIAGGSGFLGKVWLAMALEKLDDLGKVYVLLRRSSHGSALSRFESLINSSYVFKSLHEKFGSHLTFRLSERVEVLEGDITAENLGLPAATVERLRKDLDLFINCVGLVDFNPDIRDALSTNVEGALNAARFTSGLSKAALLHVSTCYVAGSREGRIPETIETRFSPNGAVFDPEQEYRDLKKTIGRITREQYTAQVETELRSLVAKRAGKRRRAGDVAEKMLRALRRRQLRETMVTEGVKRAQKLGWPNIYTYTKALGEALLTQRYGHLRLSVLRPSIVESALKYPIPGWNEGFNTSGPLAYLLGSWFRFFPAKIGNPFDVIPVDLVGIGMTLAGAALLTRRNRRVYQCATSDSNLFTIDRACELTSLGHRIHLRKHGSTKLKRAVLSRWDSVTVGDHYLFSIRKLGTVTRQLERLLSKIPSSGVPALEKPLEKARGALDRTNRKLAQVDEMLRLFMPYIHDYHQIYECASLREMEVLEPEFRFDTGAVKWRDYWLNIHMPGLRRWCFRAIEGKDRERLKPEHPVKLRREDVSQPKTAEAPPPEAHQIRDRPREVSDR